MGLIIFLVGFAIAYALVILIASREGLLELIVAILTGDTSDLEGSLRATKLCDTALPPAKSKKPWSPWYARDNSRQQQVNWPPSK